MAFQTPCGVGGVVNRKEVAIWEVGIQFQTPCGVGGVVNKIVYVVESDISLSFKHPVVQGVWLTKKEDFEKLYTLDGFKHPVVQGVWLTNTLLNFCQRFFGFKHPVVQGVWLTMHDYNFQIQLFMFQTPCGVGGVVN